MDKIRIKGGNALNGEIQISGAKNAALPLMAAALLTDKTLRLANLPHLADITTMANLLGQLGVSLHLNGGAGNGGHAGRVLELTAATIAETRADYDLVRKMRASVLVLGPLVARCGHAEVSLPGGCAIGTRPVDLHLRGLGQLGAEIELRDGYVIAKAPNGLVGAKIVFPVVSVGATENLLMAASLAKGETALVNAAREPEITDLAHCLIAMGAKIDGVGTDTLTVQGVGSLHAAEHTIVADRIEAGTYAMAAAIAGGAVELLGVERELIGALAETLVQAGVSIEPTGRRLKVARNGDRVSGVVAGQRTDIRSLNPVAGFRIEARKARASRDTARSNRSIIRNADFETGRAPLFAFHCFGRAFPSEIERSHGFPLVDFPPHCHGVMARHGCPTGIQRRREPGPSRDELAGQFIEPVEAAGDHGLAVGHASVRSDLCLKGAAPGLFQQHSDHGIIVARYPSARVSPRQGIACRFRRHRGRRRRWGNGGEHKGRRYRLQRRERSNGDFVDFVVSGRNLQQSNGNQEHRRPSFGAGR